MTQAVPGTRARPGPSHAGPEIPPPRPFQRWWPTDQEVSPHPINNTPRMLDYSRKMCRFEEAQSSQLAIDEKGTLPYKPRQLSAVTRLDRGGLFEAEKWPAWACQHPRTYLIYQADRRPQQARSQRRTTREADLPTQQTGAQAPPWLPRAHRHDRRPQSARRTPCPRPQTSERLVSRF